MKYDELKTAWKQVKCYHQLHQMNEESILTIIEQDESNMKAAKPKFYTLSTWAILLISIWLQSC